MLQPIGDKKHNSPTRWWQDNAHLLVVPGVPIAVGLGFIAMFTTAAIDIRRVSKGEQSMITIGLDEGERDTGDIQSRLTLTADQLALIARGEPVRFEPSTRTFRPATNCK
jgi:hypothetical protein